MASPPTSGSPDSRRDAAPGDGRASARPAPIVAGVRRITCVPLSLLLATTAVADPLSADRPGVANPPDVVAPGAIQLEGGLAFERDARGTRENANTITAPGALLRVGLLSPLELRVSADGFVFEEVSGGDDRSSGSDLVLGARVRLLEPQGLRPAAALQFDLSLPTGGSAVTRDGVDPSGLFLVEWGFCDRFVLDANLELASVSLGEQDSRRAFQVAPALSLGASLGARASVFVEYHGTFSDESVPDMHAADGGFTWLLGDDLQLDVSAGAGLDDDAPDFLVSAGVAWRFFLP